MYEVEFNGRYFKLTRNDYDMVERVLLRPDIGGGDNITGFEYTSDMCRVDYLDMEDFNYVLDTWGSRFFRYVNDKKWDHKESKKYKDKKCDHYYDDGNDESIYVYDDYVYVITEGEYDIMFEYKWEAPMEDFVLKEKDYPKCVKENRKVAEIPSEDYVMCSASNVKIAILAIFVALVSALF